MNTVATNSWKGGWTPPDAPEIGFAFVPANSRAWAPGPWPGLEALDLGVAEASNDVLGARRIRTASAGAPPDTGWHCHDADFDFVYILRGSVTVETDSGEHYTLGPGAAGTHPAFLWRRYYGASADLEYVQVTVPGEPSTIEGRDSQLPPRAHQLDPDRKPIYTFDTPETYALGDGPRSYFKYRDLETTALTDGRIHIHVVRATEPGSGTGWHYHSMSQWFMILAGSSVLYVEDMPKQEMTALDSMCLGHGTRHDVAPFSGDYVVLEMCAPAVYDTVGVPPPEHIDPPLDRATP